MAEVDASKCCVVLVTAPSKEIAEQIATVLVKEQLAACVSLMPVASVYVWDDQLQQDDEWQLVIKTMCDRIKPVGDHCPSYLEARILALHPYDVPEIIAIPLVAGSQPYLSWIATQVNPDSV